MLLKRHQLLLTYKNVNRFLSEHLIAFHMHTSCLVARVLHERDPRCLPLDITNQLALELDCIRDVGEAKDDSTRLSILAVLSQGWF
jgi:hypothetical protein